MPESTSSKENPRDRAREELLAQQAFEHYCTRLGPNPTPNGLHIYYVKAAREDPDNTDWIPSRNRNKIYEWHKKYDWDTRYEQRVLQRIEADRNRYEEMRSRGQDNLSLLIDDAVLKMKQLVNSPDDKIALQAAVQIFDRTGLISHDKLPKKERKDPKEGSNNLPKPGASQEEMVRWLRENT